MSTKSIRNPDGTYTTYDNQSYTPSSASTTVSSNTLTQQPEIQLPPPPTPTNTGAINASIPTPADIINTANPETSAQTTQKNILDSIAQLTGSSKSLATYENTSENQAGIPDLSKTVRSLSTQLQGLNDQADKLNIDYQYTVPNSIQEQATGRGVTAGGVAPIQASELRKIQIQQGVIASQSLTAKAALYAANNDYLNAKDAADKSAQVLFDAQEQEIKHRKAQLDAIKPTLDREQSKAAALQQAELADRQVQIQFARDDFKTGQGLAIAAMKLRPTDPEAQYAAQQALKLDPNDPQYLQKVMGLVGKYQQDPLAIQKAADEHAKALADIKKTNAEANAVGVPTITNPNAAPYAPALSVILGSEKLTKEQKGSIINAVNAGQDPVAVLKNQAKNVMGQTQGTTVTKYETAKSSLQDIDASLRAFYAAGGTTDFFTGNYEKVLNKLGTLNNPNLVDIATQIQANLQVYRNAVSGTAYSVQEGNDIASIFPGINKSQGLNTAILSGRMKAFDSTIDASYRSVLGSTYDALKTSAPPTQSTQPVPKQVNYQGKVYNVDPQGNMTPA